MAVCVFGFIGGLGGMYSTKCGCSVCLFGNSVCRLCVFSETVECVHFRGVRLWEYFWVVHETTVYVVYFESLSF